MAGCHGEGGDRVALGPGTRLMGGAQPGAQQRIVPVLAGGGGLA
jgi:hypothetical protein